MLHQPKVELQEIIKNRERERERERERVGNRWMIWMYDMWINKSSNNKCYRFNFYIYIYICL